MTWVKLCGMTRRQDVEAAVALGADAVGFVLYEGSPRRVGADDAARLGAGIPIGRFLVTVDETPERLVDMALAAGATGVQPHGRHATGAAAAALAAGLAVLYPVPVGAGPIDVNTVPAGCTPILDTKSTRHGGTGRPFDWNALPVISRDWVLAGGLTPGTVGAALRALGPWGVDVASGVETAPGEKDRDLMREFIEATR